MLGGDEATFAENRRAFERIPQLSHVARPGVTEQCVLCVAGEPCWRTTEELPDFLQKSSPPVVCSFSTKWQK
jgi:hypothetical protein